MIYTLTLNPALDRELTVHELSFNDVLRATAVRNDIGGKGFNISRMLAVLGSESVAMGFAGGRTGEALQDGLQAQGIRTEFTWVSGETRTNISVVAPERGNYIKINEPGPTISPQERQELHRQVRSRVQQGDWWILAGSLPPGIPEDFYADLISDIRAFGGNVIFDSSGAALKLGCAAQPTLIKPNASEASQLTGITIQTVEDALKASQQLYSIPYVAISLGGDGAFLAYEGQGWVAKPPRIQERNPTGAGDSMVAGLVLGLSQGDPLHALRLGVACGAATASHEGTAIGTREEIAALAEQVEITKL